MSAARLTADVLERARIVDLSIEETDIEEVVRRIYRGQLGARPDDDRLGAEPLE